MDADKLLRLLLDQCFYNTDDGLDWRFNEMFVLHEDMPELNKMLEDFLEGK